MVYNIVWECSKFLNIIINVIVFNYIIIGIVFIILLLRYFVIVGKFWFSMEWVFSYLCVYLKGLKFFYS